MNGALFCVRRVFGARDLFNPFGPVSGLVGLDVGCVCGCSIGQKTSFPMRCPRVISNGLLDKLWMMALISPLGFELMVPNARMML